MKLDIYVDGSYNALGRKCYGGVVIVDENNEAILAQRYDIRKKEFTVMNNAGGELYAAMFALTICKRQISECMESSLVL